VSDLNPGLRPARIAIGGGFKIIQRAVIVAEPERINATAIPKLSQHLRLSRRFTGGDLIEGDYFTPRQRINSRHAQSKIDVLAIGDFHRHNADHLATHVEERTPTVAVRDWCSNLNDPTEVRHLPNGRDDPI